ncbi:MAG: HepT-like ribonuclease domain-containing protein [Caulobacteraceae bacterium]
MRSVRVRLEDIAEAIAGIEQTLAGVDFQAFSESWPIQRAVERGLEIISEASRALPEDLKAAHRSVPWPQIAAMGNILRHEYQRVEPLIVWNITASHLRILSETVREVLTDEAGLPGESQP